jgi:hypothetical protein
MPVVVMIDDFQKIRRFSELNTDESNVNFWTPFKDSIRSHHVPHIFSGVPQVIEKILFGEALLGDSLEMIDLPGLEREDSVKLFKALCEVSGLKVEIEPAAFVDRFSGNPSYIKNFVQAARHAGGGVLSKEIFQRAYQNEVTVGRTYKYWTFILKTYVRQLGLRKPSLKFLYSFCSDGKDELPEEDMLESILELLHDSGCIETGFSETVLADEVLKDIIKSLYLREIENEHPDRVRELLPEKKRGEVKESGPASFTMAIPVDRKAGLVAIKTLEQVARSHNVPLKSIEKLQLAMADLFSNFLVLESIGDSFILRINCGEGSFSVEIKTPQEDLSLSEKDTKRISAYVDDLKIENAEDGALITLTRGISEDIVPLPEN